MKPHLPYSLLLSLLSSYPAITAQTVDIPVSYETLYLNGQNSITEQSYDNTTYKAYVLTEDVTITPTISGASSIALIEGGNILFTSTDVASPYSLSFNNGTTRPFSNVKDLQIIDLKHFEVTNAQTGYNGNFLFTSSECNINISNINDNNSATDDVLFNSLKSNRWDKCVGGVMCLQGDTTVNIYNNGNVAFTNNSATGGVQYGGYGGSISIRYSNLTLNNNESVTFSKNSASKYGGAIYSYYGNMSIQNNDSVLFEKNVEISNDTYRLRSIYADSGSSDTILLSSSEGNSIEFRDSIYVGAGNTLKLNSDYTDGNGIVYKQTGDILFTGKYTEEHLTALKGNSGTQSEILNSRTSEIKTMTNLYGGRLRIEDGAIYKSQGITTIDDSMSTVRVSNAELDLGAYELTLNSTTTLEISGKSDIKAQQVTINEGAHLLINFSESKGATTIIANLALNGSAEIVLNDRVQTENTLIFSVEGTVNGWDSNKLTISGTNEYNASDFTWSHNSLILNYNAETFNPYYKGVLYFTEPQSAPLSYQFYESINFEYLQNYSSGGAIFGDSYDNSDIILSNNGKVVFNENSAAWNSGGAIYNYYGGDIIMNNNASVIFCKNSASSGGGAIYGSNIVIADNKNVLFEKNESVSDWWSNGGAINGSNITLYNNGNVKFDKNSANSRGGAIYAHSITLEENDSVLFSNNSASPYVYHSDISIQGGAIHSNTVELINNTKVTFEYNKAIDSSGYLYDSHGGAIHSESVTIFNNKYITFLGNTTIASEVAYGGAIYGQSITLESNENVTFSDNSAKSTGARYYSNSRNNAYGGAISGNNITMSNNGRVIFSSNTSSSHGGALYGENIILDNNADINFVENKIENYHSLIPIQGGAIAASSVEVMNNGNVTFAYNKATDILSNCTISTRGGAIYGDSIKLENNSSVTFKENAVNTTYGTTQGGAIFVSDNLSIANNDSVLFEKNAEINNGKYRLRSIVVAQNGNLTLSAAEDKSIEFRDSVYIDSGSTVKLNADYINKKGEILTQTGDIIFTGKYTENDIQAVKNSAATTEEIIDSRTSVILGNVTLYGGTLRVEEQAILQTSAGLVIEEGCAGSVKVQNAELNAGSNDIYINSSGTLELSDGATISARNINIATGAYFITTSTKNSDTQEVALFSLREAAQSFNSTMGATIHGNLTFEAGSTLIADGSHFAMTDDSILTFKALSGEEKINLVLTLGAEYGKNDQVLLFSDVDVVKFILNGEELTSRVFSASDFFTGEWINEQTTLNYDNGIIYVQNVNYVTVPEPTTTTLSLLALVALASRRRRSAC